MNVPVALAGGYANGVATRAPVRRSGQSMPVVCGACKTINRDSAKFCQGCTGRLPAFFAGARESAGSEPRRPAGFQTDRASAAAIQTDSQQAVKSSRAPFIWSMAMLLLLFVAFVSWFAGYSMATRRPTPTPAAATAAAALPQSAAVAPVIPDAKASVDVPDPVVASKAEAPVLADRSVPAEPRPRVRAQKSPPFEPRATRSSAAPAAASVEASAPSANLAAVESFAPGEGVAPAYVAPRASSSPLAHCVGFNFLERAICLNNRCAQASSAGHPECTEILRQRRLDEARRNPSM